MLWEMNLSDQWDHSIIGNVKWNSQSLLLWRNDVIIGGALDAEIMLDDIFAVTGAHSAKNASMQIGSALEYKSS